MLSALATVSCGGGGGSENPIPNAPPIAQAGPAQSVLVGSQVMLDGGASSDTDGDPLSFSWALAGVPAGSAAALTGATSARPSFTTDREGTYSLSLVVSDGKASSAPASVTVTATSNTALQIVLDKADPLSGTVQLSLNRSLSNSVAWLVDLQPIGTGSSTAGSPINWDTTKVGNGTRLITARIATSPTAFSEVRRTVNLANSNLAIDTRVAGITDLITVDARALSEYRIARVSATFVGRDAGSFTAPNTCWDCAAGVANAFRFAIDVRNTPSGSYPMVITASDDSGASRSSTLSIRVTNPPRITLTTPVDGAFAYGALRVTGTATSIAAGAVNVTAALGGASFLNASGNDFSGSYDLAGVTPGPYTLTVRATDNAGVSMEVQRQVIVASSANLSHVPVFQLPKDAILLDAEGERLLYSTADRSVWLRNLVQGAEVKLADSSALSTPANWQLENGRSYVSAKGQDCASACIYEWSADGQRRNLSALDPDFATGGNTAYHLYPVARADKLIWVKWVGPSPTGTYTLFDAVTRQFTPIPVPAGVRYVGNINYDFTNAGGILRFVYWAQTSGEGTNSVLDLYRWNSGTGVSTRLTQGGARNVYPATDAERFAWEQSPIGGSPDNLVSLVVAPLAANAGTVIAEGVRQWSLRDGVLTWIETPAAGRTIKASAGAATSELSNQPSALLHGNGNGRVVYSARGKTYSWNGTTRITSLRADTTPENQRVLIADGYMIFAVGPSLYRIPLD